MASSDPAARTRRARPPRSLTLVLPMLLLIAASCGDDDATESTEAPTTASETTSTSTTTIAAATTIAATTTTTTSTPTTSTTTPTTTTTTSTTTSTTVPPPPPTPEEACRSYIAELGVVLDATAVQLEAGATITGSIADGVLSESDAAPQLAALSETFQGLLDGLNGLGEPPEAAIPVGGLIGQTLEFFVSAYDFQAQGAAAGDPTLLDQGLNDLNAGAALLGEVAGAFPDCAAPPDVGTGPTEFATPEEFDLTVFFRLAESLLESTDSVYAGTTPEVLTASAQAACRVLLDGGDIRAAIEAAIAASPLAGQSFGADEQQFVLLVVTRGAKLWCPSVIADEDTFTSTVISTIVDVFFDD